jgi:hypothetical protein
MAESDGTIIGLMEQNERRTGLIDSASAQMHELMKLVREYSGKGKVVITFEVSCDKNEENALQLDCYSKVTLPEKPRRKALVFHDAKRKVFSKTDPKQLELLAEREEMRAARETELAERGIARIGRGEVSPS